MPPTFVSPNVRGVPPGHMAGVYRAFTEFYYARPLQGGEEGRSASPAKKAARGRVTVDAPVRPAPSVRRPAPVLGLGRDLRLRHRHGHPGGHPALALRAHRLRGGRGRRPLPDDELRHAGHDALLRSPRRPLRLQGRPGRLGPARRRRLSAVSSRATGYGRRPGRRGRPRPRRGRAQRRDQRPDERPPRGGEAGRRAQRRWASSSASGRCPSRSSSAPCARPSARPRSWSSGDRPRPRALRHLRRHAASPGPSRPRDSRSRRRPRSPASPLLWLDRVHPLLPVGQRVHRGRLDLDLPREDLRLRAPARRPSSWPGTGRPSWPGGLVSSRFVRRIGNERLVLGSAVLALRGASLMAFAPSGGAAAVGAVAAGLGFAAIYPTTLAVVGGRFAAFTGTAFSFVIAVGLAGGMLAPWLAGKIAEASSLRRGPASSRSSTAR
ncbi:MAG: hypothetical protein M0C28_47950 [Candidatus Moduliflexus flocculans]|nr:hypothetical protein [Candidatus Moduliflexus flocculans]